MRFLKTHICIIAIFFCALNNSVADNKHGLSITYEDYLLLRDKYAEVIVYNHFNDFLLNYIGEVGEENTELNAFFVKRQDGMFHLLIEQFADNQKCYVNIYNEIISDTTRIFVYPKSYPLEVLLYTKPDLKSNFEEFYIENINLFMVTDVYNTWLYVNFIYKGSRYQGWLPNTEYCSAIYTTCS
ncbi:MAG: hypothetical protein IJS13_03135 [Paludibacteraceae bacterium]|nr:hypothetical protein [Paludibacteraceae bacterium]